MSKLPFLAKYFTTGTAEGDRHILDEAFVPLGTFFEIINPPFGSPRLLIGKKGSGKSALITTVEQKFREHLPVLSLKPADLDFSALPEKGSLGELTRISHDILVRAIAAKLGGGLRGYISTDDQKVLSAHAANTGSRPLDGWEQVSKVLGEVGVAATRIDFSRIARGFEKTRIADLKEAITQNLGKSEKVFYLLIDDTDQVAAPGDSAHLNRIWAFMLAARNLSQACENIRCLITLRTEIWVRLTRDDAGQRDQVDHFRPLVSYINPDEGDVARIVERRFALAIRDSGLAYQNDLYAPFFEDRDVVIPGTDQTRTWHDFLVKRSRSRPRDAIQLVAQLIAVATKRKGSRITRTDVDSVLPKYSEERVDDLKREADKECPHIKEIIRSFAEARFTEGYFAATSEELRDHLKKIPSRFAVRLYSQPLAQNSAESAFKLWEYLWDLGFVSPRLDDPSQPKGYTHLSPSDLTDFVSPARWTDFQRVKWDIHPAYRDYLITERNRFGLPARFRNRGRT